MIAAIKINYISKFGTSLIHKKIKFPSYTPVKPLKTASGSHAFLEGDRDEKNYREPEPRARSR